MYGCAAVMNFPGAAVMNDGGHWVGSSAAREQQSTTIWRYMSQLSCFPLDFSDREELLCNHGSRRFLITTRR
jgi:hypothetical protein